MFRDRQIGKISVEKKRRDGKLKKSTYCTRVEHLSRVIRKKVGTRFLQHHRLQLKMNETVASAISARERERERDSPFST